MVTHFGEYRVLLVADYLEQIMPDLVKDTSNGSELIEFIRSMREAVALTQIRKKNELNYFGFRDVLVTDLHVEKNKSA
jgi:hypothetical protein